MFVVIALASFLPAGNLAAQSLEETYAKLCSKPAEAKTEACQILSKSLVEKLQAQASGQGSTTSPTGATSGVQAPDAATLALWRKRWGVYADLVGMDLAGVAASPTPKSLRLAMLESKYRWDWKVPGIEMVQSVTLPDGTVHQSGSTRWDEGRNQLVILTPGFPDAYAVVAPDGSVRQLDYSLANVTSRSRGVRVPDGVRYIGEMMTAGVWAATIDVQYVEYSPERIAQARRAIDLEEQQLAQQQRMEKQAKSQQRAAMFNSVVQGVAQGLSEVNTGGYAEAQANLDATVADIQNAAAVERQQQALAAQQAQARAAEEQRQKHAENARWVAEKEQAAVEYRSGQVDAAAARQQAQSAALAERPTIAAQPRPISTAATQQESKCSEAPGFRKIIGYAEKTRELAMRSMMETPHLEPLQDVSCTQPPNLGYTLEGWWKCTAMAPTGLMVKHCPQSNSGVSSQ